MDRPQAHYLLENPEAKPPRASDAYPPLTSLLRSSLARHADRIAVEGREWILSYRDLERESLRLAGVLRHAGVGPGLIVPMLMDRSPRFVVAMLALLRCGAAYAPIDLASPPSRQAAVLEQLDSPVLLVDGAVSPAAAHAGRRLDVARELRRACPTDGPPWPDTAAAEALYVMFTSGSTGPPKGVVIPHGGVARLIHDADYARFDRDARWAQLASLAFDASTLEIWAPLLHGGCCVILETAVPSIVEISAFLAERRITDAWLTSALFNAIVDEDVDALGGLRQLATGGERVSPRHVKRCLERWPRLQIINGYGPTENTTFSLCHAVRREDLAGPGELPIGRPIRGTSARVMSLASGDAHQAIDCAIGEAGELWVGGAGVAIGYLGDPVLTQQKFICRDGDRWYRTGDVVLQRPGGEFEFLGRTDRQVKLRGHRVELEEVERTLAACPGVGEAAVALVGESSDDRHLAAFYTLLPGQPVGADEVREWLRARLAPAAVPASLHQCQALPLNLNGKVDRARLRETSGAAEPPPGPHPGAWSSETEQRLAAIWQRHLPAAQLERRSDFMRAGGNSLAALRVASDISRAFHRDIGPIDVLRHTVLADLARVVDQAPARRVQSLPGAGEAGAAGIGLSRSQETMLLASALDASGAAYLTHVAILLDDALPEERLRDAFALLVQRHPMLRTTALVDADHVRPGLLERLPEGWWERLEIQPAGLGMSRWPAQLLARINRPLDLGRAGPMRVAFGPMAGGGHLLIWTVHHFAIDEAGIDIALAELDRLLQGDSLPPVHGSAHAFAAVEQAGLDAQEITDTATRLASALRGRDPPLLPPPRRGGELDLLLQPAQAGELLTACDRWGVTAFTPIVVAYGKALQRVFGTEWRFVLTPFSRRAEPHVQEAIGYLLDVRLVEAGARPGEAPEDTLARVHLSLLAAQRPSFAPVHRVAEVLDGLDPALRTALTQFAVTWRTRPQRALEIGRRPAALLHVPQSGARFGLTLHVRSEQGALGARLEATDQALADGRAGAVGVAFAQELSALCTIPRLCLHEMKADDDYEPTPPAQRMPGPPGPFDGHARDAWIRRVGAAPADAQAHFLRCGGNSLLAMRLAADLRRATGTTIDLAAFLRQPTFGRLCELLARQSATPPGMVTLLGALDFEQVMLVLPGLRGSAAGMYLLAQELHRLLPQSWAVAIVDLQEVMTQAPEGGRADFLAQRLELLARGIGIDRIGCVVGYSLGGLLAMEMLARLERTHAPRLPVCLVDTYAPHRMRLRGTARWLRLAVSVAMHPVTALARARQRILSRPTDRAASAESSGPADEASAPWYALLEELARRPAQTGGVSATLIHSTIQARQAGLVRRRTTNGFDTRAFASFRHIAVPIDHDAMRGPEAPAVARIIAQGLQA